MLERIEQRNRRVWGGHTHLFEDLTHTLGGIGLGLLLAPVKTRTSRTLGYALVALSALLHGYAYVTAPSKGLLQRVAWGRR